MSPMSLQKPQRNQNSAQVGNRCPSSLPSVDTSLLGDQEAAADFRGLEEATCPRQRETLKNSGPGAPSPVSSVTFQIP